MKAPGKRTVRPRQSKGRAVLIAIAIMAPAALIIGALAAVPLLAGRRSETGPSTEYATGNLRTQADLVIAPSGDFILKLEFRDTGGLLVKPVDLAVIATAEMHPMAPIIASINEIASGSYEATGRLPMQGRWRFRTTTDQGGFDMTGYAGPAF